ncbi:unnamed protein product, partial [Linum tenue]
PSISILLHLSISRLSSRERNPSHHLTPPLTRLSLFSLVPAVFLNRKNLNPNDRNEGPPPLSSPSRFCSAETLWVFSESKP